MRYLNPFKNNAKSVLQKPPASQPFVLCINKATKLSHCIVQRQPTLQLFAARWADSVSLRSSTGYSAFELLYDRDYFLVDFSLESESAVNWEGQVGTSEDLLITRMRIRKYWPKHRHPVTFKMRNGNKNYYGRGQQLRKAPLRVGDLVFVRQSLISEHEPKTHPEWWQSLLYYIYSIRL